LKHETLSDLRCRQPFVQQEPHRDKMKMMNFYFSRRPKIKKESNFSEKKKL